MTSSAQKKSSGVFGGLLKFFGLLLLVIALILVTGYCYLKFSMGIDVFDVVKKLNLLKQGASESQVVTQPYTDQDAVEGLSVLFGENTIYVNSGEGYVFDENEFVASELVGEINLTEEQFASIMNLFLNNIYSSTDAQDFAQYVGLKQVQFSNFSQSEGKTMTDVTVVAKIDFSGFKDNMSENDNVVVSFLNNLIPNNLFITANFTVTVDESNANTFTTKSNYVIINKLSKEDSQGVLDLFSLITGSGSGKELIEDVNSTFATLMFGTEDQEGFLNVITGCTSFSFEQESSNIYISLKKA